MEKLEGITRKWEKHGFCRFYFLNGYLKKANAFWQATKPSSGKYVFPLLGGFVVAEKCYNGCVKKELEELVF